MPSASSILSLSMSGTCASSADSCLLSLMCKSINSTSDILPMESRAVWLRPSFMFSSSSISDCRRVSHGRKLVDLMKRLYSSFSDALPLIRDSSVALCLVVSNVSKKSFSLNLLTDVQLDPPLVDADLDGLKNSAKGSKNRRVSSPKCCLIMRFATDAFFAFLTRLIKLLLFLVQGWYDDQSFSWYVEINEVASRLLPIQDFRIPPLPVEFLLPGF
mmetsp:Transcript_1690/g.10384  ORF Transcript_1690/g.10384 Transcript_1690/m.10384 type:complete len:216 (+) Transcript_1690:1433-2080(+)